MIIGLVRDSVMQCFCHTCRVPALSLTASNRRTAPLKKTNVKVRTKQPKTSKKVKFITTEIRCQEKSKGGLSYEVILAEPNAEVPPPIIQRPITPAKNVSVDEIERKLKEAEERRISLEAKKIANLSLKMSKIDETTRKKDELLNEFINQTKESLTAKMEQFEGKRETIMSELKEKLKTHSEDIAKTRNSLEYQKVVERIAIDEKLKSAAVNRDENIKKKLERLKEHNTTKIEIKIAADARENEKSMELKHIFENKLYAAELNREKELQKKLDSIRKHERRAEAVRQNKAALNNNNNNNCSQNDDNKLCITSD